MLLGGAGGLIAGCDTASIAATLPAIRAAFPLGDYETGLLVAGTLLATLLGSVSAASLAARCGRVRSIALACWVLLAAEVSMIFVASTRGLFFLRVCSGGAIGMLTALCPLLLAESAPTRLRGRVAGLFQISLSLGVALAYLVHLAMGAVHWRRQFLFAGAVAAMAGLLGLGSEQGVTFPTDRAGWKTLLDTCYRPYVWRVLLLATFNQLCGVNALVFYRGILLGEQRGAGMAADEVLLVLSIFSLVITALGVGIVDRVGRRRLLLWGAVGMSGSLCALTWLQQTANGNRLGTAAGLLLFDAAFSLSQGAAFWVVVPELLPAAVRAQGLSAAAGVLWFWTIAITFAFPSLFAAHPVLPFAIFSGMTLLQIPFLLFFLPETRGRAFSDACTAESR